MTPNLFRLFVYGSLLSGQPDHALLGGAERVELARTSPIYYLVDLGRYAALVAGGTTAVVGEVYEIDLSTRTKLDVARQVPVLFQRVRIQLVDTKDADAYLMSADQVRGRRRLHHGDWHQRFAPNVPRTPPSPWVQWARSRFPKR